MRFFSSKETKIVVGILSVVVIVSLFNFRTALRRARDNQRKNDLGDIVSALDKFNTDNGLFPLSTPDGKIKACGNAEKVVDLSPCEWGKDKLMNYMTTLPNDPHRDQGASYFYVSDGRFFQVFASLEGKDEDEYNTKIENRNIHCGTRICNYGKASSRTPLDKSLEEYENEINAKK